MVLQTIEWRRDSVRIIDQTLLPGKLVYRDCRDVKALWRAIRTLQVRGAPAIGIAAAFGVVLGVRGVTSADHAVFAKKLDEVIRYLATARPTAVNLFWALERMRTVAQRYAEKPVTEIQRRLRAEALLVVREDKEICRAMGAYGARLIRSGDTILTHCNAGALATADYGTALGVIYRAQEEGKKIKVYADETRPLLQGARLTAWELMRHKVDVTLICDNMAASLMAQGKIDKIIVGADRIAANGDVANKIGTYSLAVLAHHHRIPFYVAAPVSTFDMTLASGRGIPIEQRGSEEVAVIGARRVAPAGVKIYNPSFDVTPNRLVTAIVTEKGIFRRPFKRTLKKLS
ncbi:MAG: S-methyl-5-thioribose-1-phosphate isomerase [Candidatus Omnitrophota bacterium]